MRSATAISFELDDIDAAIEELAEQINEKLVMGKESIGMLFCQPHMEQSELAVGLKNKLGIDIVGGSTAGAASFSNDGYHELALTLHVLTADDCFFSAAISRSLAEGPKEAIHDVYADVLEKLHRKNGGADPKLVFCIAPLLPTISSDDGLATLHEVCGGLPVFGFMAADDFEFAHQRILMNDVADGDRMALLLVSGNVRPLFCVNNLMSSEILSKKRVTKAHERTIVEIDGKPAYEYIRDFPFIGDDTAILWNYQFFVEMQNETDNDGVAVSRALHSYNKETGEVICFADIPQDSYIGLMHCNELDVQRSCRNSLDQIAAKIAETEAKTDYKYSTVFVVSCGLRVMFLAENKDVEGKLLKEMMPQNLTTSGVYGFGEISPTSVRDGKAKNRFHNATMTLCAL